jgi:hypothetical protein
MSQLVFQAPLGGQISLVGTNTGLTYSLNVPATNGNIITSGDTATVSQTMLQSLNGITLSSVTVPSTFTFTGTGAVALPAGTTAQEPSSPTAGMIRYNTTTNNFEGYNGTSWGLIGGGNTTATGYWQNIQSITSNSTISSGYSATSAGPITVASGVSVTVPGGSRWVIL